jgi:hypothetical protein
VDSKISHCSASLIIAGMGDFEPCVRLRCGTVLRMLVPLAPLAKERSRKHVLPFAKQEGIDRSSAAVTDVTAPYGRGIVRFKMSHKEKMAKLIENILSRQSLPRITESIDPLDEHLMGELAKRSLLLPAPAPAQQPPVSKASGGPNSKEALSRPGANPGTGPSRIDTSRVFVRPYQWDGVSWLLQLYRCGLGGILAGGECSNLLLLCTFSEECGEIDEVSYFIHTTSSQSQYLY